MKRTDLLTLPQRLRSRAGFVFALFALAAVLLLGFAGLAIDTARGVVNKAEVSRVADAVALAAAKNVRSGPTQARTVALAVGALNGIEPDAQETLDLAPIVTNPDGETFINVTASRKLGTSFMRVMGIDEMEVRSSAEATVPPVDLVLVIDQSASMKRYPSGGRTPWQRLVPAAKQFVDQFSDEIDQVGLVHFNAMAETAMELQPSFTVTAQKRIGQMKPDGDTNAEEALSFAWGELASKRARPKALKVIVFFTDGRPTAFRDSGADMGRKDGILTTSGIKSDGDWIVGWYSAPPAQDDPPNLRPDNWRLATQCVGVPECKIPGGKTWRRDDVLKAAYDRAIAAADGIRSNGFYIYSVGLGNLTAPREGQPDQDFLRKISNVDGTGVGTRGGYFFAATPEDLDRVFQAVAADILARLSQ